MTHKARMWVFTMLGQECMYLQYFNYSVLNIPYLIFFSLGFAEFKKIILHATNLKKVIQLCLRFNMVLYPICYMITVQIVVLNVYSHISKLPITYHFVIGTVQQIRVDCEKELHASCVAVRGR